MKFTISQSETRKRRHNILKGVLFSLLLILLVAFENARNPEQYSDVLLWSILTFLLLANVVNYFRHLRYLKKIRDHHLEVYSDRIQFHTDGETSRLDMDAVVIVKRHHHRQQLQHVQLILNNHRGIRLEGYNNLELLAETLERFVEKNRDQNRDQKDQDASKNLSTV